MGTLLSKVPPWINALLFFGGAGVLVLWFTGVYPEARYGVIGSFVFLLGMMLPRFELVDGRIEKMEARIKALEEKGGTAPPEDA